MPKSNAQKLAQAKYDQKAYDQILIKVKKGKRDEYREAAENLGLGQMELFRVAADEYIRQRVGGEFVPPTTTAETLTAEEKRLLSATARLSDDAQKRLVKFLESLPRDVDDKGGDSNGDNIN